MFGAYFPDVGFFGVFFIFGGSFWFLKNCKLIVNFITGTSSEIGSGHKCGKKSEKLHKPTFK